MTTAQQAMPTEALDHAAAMERAAKYFSTAAGRSMLPAEFDARVAAFFESFEKKLKESNTFAFAVLKDVPCPQDFFEAWAGRKRIWEWRHEKVGPLPSDTINGKVMSKPSDFFAALERHGRKREDEEIPVL